ncbi:MAG TPA: regulatory iron-sulfur-containing complex subunit RicT, partial [Dehalococcoidia bacterium]|nr:regulatory iron-sulfur-containing complex subunit RicT [Dehalococcoidia bacterium]
ILRQGRQVVQQENLDLYLAGFQINLEGTEATGFFHADGHVNFLALVDALTNEFDLTIHMQHAGPRDRAKIVDGYDICGLRLCCSSWMTEFPKVGIRMAKEQDLALNPDKISGVCGRLLCCLTFEFDVYKEMRGTLPKMGKKVSTPAGMGKVIQVNPLAQQVTIVLDDSYERVRVPAEEIGLAVRVEEAPNQAIAEAPAETTEKPARRSRSRRRGRDRARDPEESSGGGGSRKEGPAGLRKRETLAPSEDSDVPVDEASGKPAESKPRRRRRRRRRGAGSEEGVGGSDTGTAEVSSPEAPPRPETESPQDSSRTERPADATDKPRAEDGEGAPRRRRRRRRRRRSGGTGESGGSSDPGGSASSE